MSNLVQHPSSAGESLVDEKPVAAFLGVQPNTIQKWASQRKIPHRKINGVVRYLMSEVRSWALDECERPIRRAR